MRGRKPDKIQGRKNVPYKKKLCKVNLPLSVLLMAGFVLVLVKFLTRYFPTTVNAVFYFLSRFFVPNFCPLFLSWQDEQRIDRQAGRQTVIIKTDMEIQADRQI